MPNTDQHEEDLHLGHYINILLQRKRVFLFAFCTIFTAAALYAFFWPPVWEPQSTLFLQDDKSKQGLFGELLMSDVAPIDSEIQIIQSRTIAEETVRRIHLDWGVSDKSDGLSFKLMDFWAPGEDPLFGIFKRNPAFTIKLTSPDHYSVLDRHGNIIASGVSGQLIYGNKLKLLIADLKGRAGDSFKLELLPFDTTVEDLRKNIKAVQQKDKTNILQLSYDNRDPRLARDVVNTMVQVYLEKRISFNNEEASKTLDFIGQQFGRVEKELDTAEKNLQAYKSKSGVINLDTEASSLLDKITTAEKERADALIRKKQAEFALAAAKDAAAKGKPYSPFALADDPVIGGLAGKLADLQVQKSALLVEYTESYPAVADIKEQIAELQKKIVSTLETSITNIEKSEDATSRVIGSYEAELKKLPTAERQLAKLMRPEKVNSDIYSLLLQKREESRIAKASTISQLNIIDPANIPVSPARPKKALALVFGVFAGILMGAFIALFQDYLDDSIKDPDIAKRELGVSMMAMIPFISTKKLSGEAKEKNGSRLTDGKKGQLKQIDGKAQDKQVPLIVYQEPKSHVSEAFRSLRTAIRFSARKNKQIILVTSSFPGEGKSTTISNLAVTFALTGAKVLIMDCDLRKSTLHEKFGFKDKVPGTSDLLVGDADLENVIRQTEIPGLFIIASGTTPPNPAEMLGSEQVRSLLDSLRSRYDHILIDAPPVLAVTDAPLLTTMADIVLIVMQAGRVPVRAARQLRDTLAHVGAPVAGFVINDRSVINSYGYGYGYGYGSRYYGNYYGEEAEKETRPWWKVWQRKNGK